MKQAMNFRLSQQANTVLSELTNRLQLSKTEIIERALMRYYERKKKQAVSPLMEFAGILSSKEADFLLESIHESRLSKEDDIEL